MFCSVCSPARVLAGGLVHLRVVGHISGRNASMGPRPGFTLRLRGRRVGREVARGRATAIRGPLSRLELHDVFRLLTPGAAERPETCPTTLRVVLMGERELVCLAVSLRRAERGPDASDASFRLVFTGGEAARL